MGADLGSRLEHSCGGLLARSSRSPRKDFSSTFSVSSCVHCTRKTPHCVGYTLTSFPGRIEWDAPLKNASGQDGSGEKTPSSSPGRNAKKSNPLEIEETLGCVEGGVGWGVRVAAGWPLSCDGGPRCDNTPPTLRHGRRSLEVTEWLQRPAADRAGAEFPAVREQDPALRAYTAGPRSTTRRVAYRAGEQGAGLLGGGQQ